MVNFTLDNPKDDNNRMAGAAVTALDQGDLVTVNSAEEVVPADAANGIQGAAVGAAHGTVVDPSDPKYGSLEYVQNQLKEEQSVLVGEDDRILAYQYGFMIHDDDEAGTLTPGEPVYLAEGGGVTQDPSTLSAGSIKQIVGMAEDPNSYLLNIQPPEEVTDDTVVKDGDSTNGKTTFTVTHGLSFVPDTIQTTPITADAMGDHYVTNVTDTSFDIVYGSAPADGTDNVQLDWKAYE